MKNYIIPAISLFAMSALCACSDDDAPVNPALNPGEPTKLTLTPFAQLTAGEEAINSGADKTSSASLVVDYPSLTEVTKEQMNVANMYYPRIRRNADGEYILFFQLNPQAANTYYTTSTDLKEWSACKPYSTAVSITNALGNPDHRYYTTVDAITLPNGDMLAAASYRANKGYAKTPTDNGIAVRRSTDGGKTWGEETFVYQGTNWEPTFVRRSTGRIEIYFSQSRPEIQSSHSGTAIVWSDDNGHTWKPDFGQPAYTVVRHSWLNEQKQPRWTDQMPNTIELNNSKQLVTVTESKPNASVSDNFHISFAYSDESGDYPQLTGQMEGPAERAINIWKGAAPCIGQFPSGETVMTYNDASKFYFRMGDAKAKNWTEPTQLFNDVRGYWGALEIESPHSMLAVFPASSKVAIGRLFLNHAITATERTAKADGDNSEWSNTDQAIVTGSKSATQATLRCSADKDNIYFLVEVIDDNISADDYVNILLCPATASGNITSDARRIKVAPYGLRSTDQYAGGWHEIAMPVSVGTAFDGSIANAEDTDHGYLAEVAVPRSALKITDGEILVNLVMFDSQDGEEAIAPTTTNSLAKWIPIRGL